MSKAHVKMLQRLGACGEAVDFAQQCRSASEAWHTCERGDWLLWLLGRTCEHGSQQHRRVVLLACACARRALKYVEVGENAPRVTIETAEQWARGEAGVTLADVRAAADADADAAVYAAHYAAHYAAVYAAHYAAVYAAHYAADADAAAYADAYARAAVYAACRAQELAEMAKLVRAEFPTPPGVREESDK